MDTNILPVILAGGRGTRLWPLSLDDHPKQFLVLFSKHTLLQETVLRLQGLPNLLQPLIISNEQYNELITKQLTDLAMTNITTLLEPVGRNTAPAITLAALYATQNHHDPILLVLPSDHFITDKKPLQEAIMRAVQHANNNKLITFGITPNRPETGYGYIKRGEAIDDYSFEVEAFTEKPNELTALSYLQTGQYYWNSGMFVFRASDYIKEIAKHNPAILTACKHTYNNRIKNNGFYRFIKEDFEQSPSISVDYAVMEKTANATVIPINIGWSDLGSWEALWDISDKDYNGNIIKGDLIELHGVSNCYLQSNKKLVVKNIHDTVIIETDDGILVSRKLAIPK